MSDKNNELKLPSKQQAQLPDAWRTSHKGIENRKKAANNLKLKHGMMTGIPMICRGVDCPFFETCWIPEQDLQVGERCPIEIAAVVQRFDGYCESLGIDPENIDDIADAGFIRDLVDIEVMMLRADNHLAKSGDFIEEVVAGITPKGQEIKKPELKQAVELKERLRKERSRILTDLHATRKSKRSEDLLNENDPSSVASKIMAKVNALQQEGKIIDIDEEEYQDAEYEEIDEEVEESEDQPDSKEE